MRQSFDRGRSPGRTQSLEITRRPAVYARGARRRTRIHRTARAASPVHSRSAAPIPHAPLQTRDSKTHRDRASHRSWWRMYGMRRLLLVLALSLIASPAFAKSLYWRTFDVKARLDSDGRLHVREQQGIVFDGDWNGGERRFNIRPGQSLDLERVLRVENGQDMPMTRGDLSQVDHWDFVGDNVVRWRSRRPSDPPFQNREIDYAIEYVLSGILQKSDRGARLHHDFAFPDRAGVIQNFSLRLDLDPAWRGLINPYVLQRQT